MSKILKNGQMVFLLPLILFIFLKIPSLFEPLWYGDETIYMAVSYNMLQGKQLYTQITDNKPPLIYWLNELSLFASHHNLFIMKLIGILLGIVGFFFFYKICLIILQKHVIPIALTLFAILFGSILFEGNIANAENLLIPLNITAIYLIVFDKKLHPYLRFTLAGILFALASLLKVTAVFDIVAVGIYLLAFKREQWKEILLLIISFGIPWGIVGFYYLAHHAFLQFAQAILLNNFSYVNYYSFTFLGLTALKLKLLITVLITGVLVFWGLRRKAPLFTFLALWSIWDLFNITFDGRDYPHYALLFIPPFILFFCYIINYISTTSLSKSVRIWQWTGTSILFLVSLWILIAQFSAFHYTGSERFVMENYYQTFVSYATGQLSRERYTASFQIDTAPGWEPHPTNAFYQTQIASYIDQHTNPSQCIFVWSNLPGIYPLANRTDCTDYVTDYHVGDDSNNQAQIMNTLASNPATLIITSPNGYTFSQLQTLLEHNYQYIKTIDYFSLYQKHN